MMIKRVRIMIAVGFCVAWASVALGQGLYWETTTTGAGKDARASQTYAMPKMMKIVNSDGQVLIFRSDQDKFVSIDPKKQVYHEMAFSEMESAAKSAQAQMETARAQMEKRMKGVSPEQRSMMEKMMPKMPGAEAAKASQVVVKNTGEAKKISGYACTKYVATEDGKTVLVAWTTKDVKGFQDLRDDLLALQKRFARANRAFGSGVADAYAKIEGFPMETEMGDIKTLVTKVEARTTATSEFDVPAGYKKETLSFPKAHP